MSKAPCKNLHPHTLSRGCIILRYTSSYINVLYPDKGLFSDYKDKVVKMTVRKAMAWPLTLSHCYWGYWHQFSRG